MPAKNLQRIDEENLFLHIYNKGIEKRIIFNDEEDYKIFLDYLNEYLTAPRDLESTKKTFQVHGRTFRGIPHQPKNYFNEVELVASNLMPSEFHLLLRQLSEDSVEKLLRSLCTKYVIYFNKKYQRTGSLFEGPYKSVLIKEEDVPELTRDFQKKPLERSNLASTEPTISYANLNSRSRMPEFLTVSVFFFVLLVTLSLRNIWIAEYKSVQSLQPKPVVLSSTTETEPEVKPETEPIEAVKIVFITVKSEDGSKVNIRKEPDKKSEKIAKAKDGDTFELISLNSDWYKVKLTDGSVGFISAEFVKEEN